MATATTDDPIEGEVVEVSTSSAIASLNSSEIDTQITTAKMYPRSLKSFRNEALEMATLDEPTAQECMYGLKRGGKVIEGPSARMAEIVASAWGNCRVGARIVDRDSKFVTAQGTFLDLQKNYACSIEVPRRITDKKGNTFNDDMIGVTANAACSIALRNVVFKGVPKALWWPIYAAARRTAVGDATTLSQRRGKALAAFGKMGVDEQMILRYLDVKGVQDIGLDHLGLLLGVFNSIKDGEKTIDDVFSPETGSVGAKVGKSDLEDRLSKPPADPAEPTPEELSAAGQMEKADEPESKPKSGGKSGGQSSLLDDDQGGDGYHASGM